MANQKSRLTAVSLFTGAGGLDLGAYLAGCISSVCVELDEGCLSTLAQNRQFSESQILGRDIREVTSEEILALTKLHKKDNWAYSLVGRLASHSRRPPIGLRLGMRRPAKNNCQADPDAKSQ